VGTILNTPDVKPAARKRRPNYSLAFKLSLAKQACAENVSVAQLALEHGLNTNMVFKWRRQLRAGLLSDSPALLPVAVAPALPVQPGELHGEGVIEIRIGATQVRIEGRPDTATLETVLRSLRR
jgi:transposase